LLKSFNKKKNNNEVNVADANTGANGKPKTEKANVERYTNVGKVVPNINNVLSLVSKSNLAFSARNNDSECS